MRRMPSGFAWAMVVTVTGGGCALPSATPSTRIDAPFALQPGDLLLQDLDGGPLCEAIEKVTHGYGGASFTHLGIVCGPAAITSPYRADSPTAQRVLEAVSGGVRITPLDTFLARSKDARGRPKVVVGRLKAEHRFMVPAARVPTALVPTALDYGLSKVGRPYDRVFEIGNDAFYCSELIYEMFAHGNGGQPVFHLEPMTFKDPDTGATFPVWADYFGKLGVPVPEGQPGINPGGISRSSKIEMVHAYGTPTGWKGIDRSSP